MPDEKRVPITHRLDHVNMQEHYTRVAQRISKYARRLSRMGFYFDKDNDMFERGQNRITLEYIEGRCDFTHDEFMGKLNRGEPLPWDL